jgi:hypothetical protein
MTRVVFALFTLGVLAMTGPRPGVAETYRPWCADYGGSTNCGLGAGADGAACSPRKAATSDWIRLHRPDGEIVHIKADQIVFVTSAAATAADKRARSKIQLLNGFSDVRESLEEVMQAILTDASKQISTR